MATKKENYKFFIHPPILEYLRERAENFSFSKEKDESLVFDILENKVKNSYLDKKYVEKLKRKLGIKNYALFFSSIKPHDPMLNAKFRFNTQVGDSSKTVKITKPILKAIERRDLYLEILQELKKPLKDYKAILKEQGLFPACLNQDPKLVAQKARDLFERAFEREASPQNKTALYNRLSVFLEKMGICVYVTPSHKTNPSGLYLPLLGDMYPLLLVCGSSPTRNIFTLLQAFAFCLLDSRAPILEEELWANAFAREFLSSQDALREKRSSKKRINFPHSLMRSLQRNGVYATHLVFHGLSSGTLSSSLADEFLISPIKLNKQLFKNLFFF